MKAWCKHTPESPCARCQDKHDEHEWIVSLDPFAAWAERRRHLAELRQLRERMRENETDKWIDLHAKAVQENAHLRDVVAKLVAAIDSRGPGNQEQLKALRDGRAALVAPLLNTPEVNQLAAPSLAIETAPGGPVILRCTARGCHVPRAFNNPHCAWHAEEKTP